MRVALQTGDEGPGDKVLDQRARLVRDIAIFRLHGDGRLGPDDEVGDVWRNAIGPVVAEDLEVCRIGKGGWVLERNYRGTPRCGTRLMPPQTLLADVVGDAAILRFDFVRPGDVSDQIGRLPFQSPQIVPS